MTDLVTTLLMPFIIIFCRIGGCLMVVPGFSSVRVPVRIRLFTAIALSVALAPLVWSSLPRLSPGDPAFFYLLIATETIVGAFLGLLVRLLFAALEFIAAGAAMSMGFGTMMGTPVTEAEPQAAFGAFLSMAALVLFFIVNAHHAVIIGLVRSYAIIPADGIIEPARLLMRVGQRLNDAFLLVLRLGGPFLAYGILINLIVGLLNKLTPQIPIYFISLPYTLLGGLLIAYFAFPSMLSQFAAAVPDMGFFR
ncbi:MAG: flagellar biosynthetic protein FliR [Zhengella sp.]|uniref:flagellar biosynthetic protein FliR n=1 Tax=Zhengella sp. TaxID=2282762 RepID=UPI001D3BDB29|nr:flagellar type III secretion system protein FliR [Notoacmeibacter sp.]MCC0025502.1 flagellar type III secretion system protein FliR [Brucellaceae bacterium]